MGRLFNNLILHACNGQTSSRLRAPHLWPAVQHQTTRDTSTESRQSRVSVDSNETWHKIYHLPLVRLASAFNRLKIYQAALTAAGTPILYALEQAGHISANAFTVFGAMGGTGLLTLSLASLAVRQLVGIVYINSAGDQLKLAYVDFWGRRRDAFVEVADLIPESEQAKVSRFAFYQTIRLHSDSKRTYKLVQRTGIVSEPGTFARLFGE